jgi:hypothetical protein
MATDVPSQIEEIDIFVKRIETPESLQIRMSALSTVRGLTRLLLSTDREVQYGEAERSFMVGEWVVHDCVG